MSEQQQEQGQRKSFNTTALNLYNNQMASLSVGFIDQSAYIACYPVYAEQVGKQAQAGVKMLS